MILYLYVFYKIWRVKKMTQCCENPMKIYIIIKFKMLISWIVSQWIILKRKRLNQSILNKICFNTKRKLEYDLFEFLSHILFITGIIFIWIDLYVNKHKLDNMDPRFLQHLIWPRNKKRVASNPHDTSFFKPSTCNTHYFRSGLSAVTDQWWHTW